jgi:23S rRNA pseudoU1915 N3-methylase RlmH
LTIPRPAVNMLRGAARAMLAEQLYLAFEILADHTYLQ